MCYLHYINNQVLLCYAPVPHGFVYYLSLHHMHIIPVLPNHLHADNVSRLETSHWGFHIYLNLMMLMLLRVLLMTSVLKHPEKHAAILV